MADPDGSPGERYYLRLHMLVMSSSDVLRAKVDYMISSAQLATEIKKNHVLKALKDKANLRREQIRLLTTQNPDSKTFDTTLLVAVLRHVCFGSISNVRPSPSSHPIWAENDNKNILQSMQSDLDQIVRIRNVRNTVSHTQEKESCIN